MLADDLTLQLVCVLLQESRYLTLIAAGVRFVQHVLHAQCLALFALYLVGKLFNEVKVRQWFPILRWQRAGRRACRSERCHVHMAVEGWYERVQNKIDDLVQQIDDVVQTFLERTQEPFT